MKTSHLDKAIAALEAERAALDLALAKLRALRPTGKPKLRMAKATLDSGKGTAS